MIYIERDRQIDEHHTAKIWDQIKYLKMGLRKINYYI